MNSNNTQIKKFIEISLAVDKEQPEVAKYARKLGTVAVEAIKLNYINTPEELFLALDECRLNLDTTRALKVMNRAQEKADFINTSAELKEKYNFVIHCALQLISYINTKEGL